MAFKKTESKILSRDELYTLTEDLKKSPETIVVTTNGCFDILHPGHIACLEEARAQGDILIILLNSDRSVARIKPGRPVNDAGSRARLLAALACTDYITVFDEDTPDSMLEIIKPDVHVKSSQYREEDISEKKVLDTYGGRLHLASHVDGHSTTDIINKSQNVT